MLLSNQIINNMKWNGGGDNGCGSRLKFKILVAKQHPTNVDVDVHKSCKSS